MCFCLFALHILMLFFYCFENDVDTMSDIISRIVFKHAHILSLITNLGLLSMLFIDLLVANKCDGMIVVTLLNLLGVFAMIGIWHQWQHAWVK